MFHVNYKYFVTPQDYIGSREGCVDVWKHDGNQDEAIREFRQDDAIREFRQCESADISGFIFCKTDTH